MIAELPLYWQQNRNLEHTKIYEWYFDWNIFTTLSITFFSYAIQVPLLIVLKDLSNPSQRRINKVVTRSILLDAFFYVVIGCAGYFSLFNFTDPVVIERKPPTGWARDYFLIVAAFGTCFHLLFSIPANYFPFRKQVFLTFAGREEFSQKENWLLTTVFIVVTCAVAIVFPKIVSVLSIIGGFCCCNMCFLVPMLAQLKLSGMPCYHYKNLSALVIFTTLIVAGYISVAITIYQIVNGLDWMGNRPDLAH